MNQSIDTTSISSGKSKLSAHVRRLSRRHLRQIKREEQHDGGSFKVHRGNCIGAAVSATQQHSQQVISKNNTKSAVIVRYITPNKSLIKNDNDSNANTTQSSIQLKNSDRNINQSITSFTTIKNNPITQVSFIVFIRFDI